MRTGFHNLISLPVRLAVCVLVCTCNLGRFYLLRELNEAGFHKPETYGSGRVWSNAWNVLRRSPSRGGRGRRAAVDFAVCFEWGGFFQFFFFRLFFCLRMDTA